MRTGQPVNKRTCSNTMRRLWVTCPLLLFFGLSSPDVGNVSEGQRTEACSASFSEQRVGSSSWSIASPLSGTLAYLPIGPQSPDTLPRPLHMRHGQPRRLIQTEPARTVEPKVPDAGRGQIQPERPRVVVAAKEPKVLDQERKVVPPRIRYLTELAMDIDPILAQLAKRAPAEALQLYQKMLESARQKNDAQAETQALESLGAVYYLTGQLPKSVEYYENALLRLKDHPNKTVCARAIRNLAAALIATGDYRKAETRNQEALQLLKAAGDATGARATLNNMGVLEKNRGEFAKAMTFYSGAKYVKSVSDRVTVLVLKNIGNLCWRLADYPGASDNFQQAVGIAGTLNDRAQQLENLLNISELQRETGDYEQALRNAQRALDLCRSTGETPDLALKLMGDLHLDRHDSVKAEPYIKEADYDSSLGRYYLLRGDLLSAQRYYEQLAVAARHQENLDGLFAAYTGLGKILESKGTLENAQQFYEQAVQLTEQIRSTLLLSERKDFFTARIEGFSRCDPAKALARVLLKQSKPAESIYPGEVTKARGFADNLSLRVKGRQFNVPPEILEQEIEVVAKLAALKNGRNILRKEADPVRFAYLNDRIKQAEKEFEAYVQMLREKYGEYASVKYPRPVSIEQASVGSQEYVVLFDQADDGVAIRLLKGKKVLKGFFQDWQLAEQEQEIRAFRAPFEKLRLREFNLQSAHLLYDKLLAKVLELVPHGSPVIVIPDGSLALLPLEALVREGKATWRKGKWGDYAEGIQYAGDLYPMVYYQSLTAMTLVRKLKKVRRESDKVLVMADPIYSRADARSAALRSSSVAASSDVKGSPTSAFSSQSLMVGMNLKRLSLTEELAVGLQEKYGTRAEVYTGSSCTKEKFLKRVAEESEPFRAVVLATHGFASNRQPGIREPFLVLTLLPPGTDGMLTMSEIAGLNLPADVVALVACQTGTGEKLEGEGIMSMGRSFQCAGARSVIMSLWSVFEPSTIRLMSQFFSELTRGKTKIEAFKFAREQIRKEGFEHPFFWSAFVLVGEPL